MYVFIMRHGDATLDAVSDITRELTPRGSRESRETAYWLSQQVSDIDCVLVSPYIRARQTLKVVRENLVLPDSEEILEELTPSGDVMLVASYLQVLAAQGHKAVFVVSHLPLVGYLVSELCPGQTPPMFATSGIACVEWEPQTEKGRLLWQTSPAQLVDKA
ncbi:phosphohistidine phosphatase SixA [Xenorhabdus nematophila]|uniref:Phosphohistidine phosphatase n=1 Tax=Xenorhabdus nematophila (strain ATCC 19061 / DSM 3370 / CCUG 14189 / LMG 1036 / NCIMB 9965 / AN6) TaxID=406817 RepID=D3VKY6_XENNA|nr:phosphohistidine phosphatase SixA [Xenorhabdus nematophila]CEE94133.1 phosphohistidine phosphatase [Xenorhabdus nematophila str. Anatoliense]CEF28562.1 phosphohistidine phosphatase [Xenorhabdus nematophila str. Websteri]AYA39801.1 phosphohistidine phosphatase SixA [Xenorhabdus nematophila]KHD27726.1 phosphohistidine phosphatase [Xenorhabdus nematophila]MBA0018366.1 phosphohistidine phosphatase SixA [Xenorhabdus nematophila]